LEGPQKNATNPQKPFKYLPAKQTKNPSCTCSSFLRKSYPQKLTISQKDDNTKITFKFKESKKKGMKKKFT
jgi:hypothetical protein